MQNIYNSHDEILNAIERLREVYIDGMCNNFGYTLECIKRVEQELEYSLAMNDAVTWYSAECDEGFACLIGECMVRLLGGKWCIETGRYADNSTLKVLINGKLYYPRELRKRVEYENNAVSSFFESFQG